MTVFLTYGYQRVTMEDIARASDMSRPALYLLFRNKAEIYRALAGRVFGQCTAVTDAALAGGGTLAERLARAVDGVMSGIFDEIEQTPHGTELVDLKTSLASDLIERWMNMMAGRYAAAIEADAMARNVDLAARGLSATGLANTLICGIDGAKQRFRTREEQRSAVRDLVRVIELALT